MRGALVHDEKRMIDIVTYSNCHINVILHGKIKFEGTDMGHIGKLFVGSFTLFRQLWLKEDNVNCTAVFMCVMHACTVYVGGYMIVFASL